MGLIIFLLGACFGSFLNVCIYRLPRGKSIAFPSSFCTKCRKSIRWYDNIPVLSFFLLKGKCRDCGKAISPRYPAVELLTAVLVLLLYEKFSLTPPFFAYLVFSLALIVISFIDWDTFLIPDVIDIPGIAAGLAASVLCAGMFLGSYDRLGSFLNSLTGAAAGAAIVGVLAVLGKLVWKKDAMGGGDLKLLAMIGAFLGWRGVLLTMFFGSLIGTLLSVTLILLKKKKWDDYVPFGPYLSLGAVISLFFKGLLFLGFFIP